MSAALLLVDLQRDFLGSPTLEPAADAVVAQAARLLEGCRALSVPVVHAWTTVSPQDDRRMAHWKRTGKWICVEGTAGHAVPEPLRPIVGEAVVNKAVFSPFCDGELERVLRVLGAREVVVAGVHLHACVRAAALDAYQRGFEVTVAEDAVASDDPLHAAVTLAYLEQRAVRFLPVRDVLARLAGEGGKRAPSVPSLPASSGAGATGGADDLPRWRHASPADSERVLWDVPVCGANEVGRASEAAREASAAWRSASVASRAKVIERLAELLEPESEALARQLAREVGKPLTQGREEAARSAALLRAVARHADDELEARCGPTSARRQQPVGVVALVTPWNNPLAIPLGKIAPALLYGNAVVWKPSPPGSALAFRVAELLDEAGCPPGVVGVVCGDRSTAALLMASESIDAVALTGSSEAGYAAQQVCARRRIPLQAELGGNNAAIVWSDADLAAAAAAVAEGAFGFAGQRCTANRRVIVEARCYEAFLARLDAAAGALVWGDPHDDATAIGPLISLGARDRVAATVARAAQAGHPVASRDGAPPGRGAYHPPTLVRCDDPRHEIAQEETFGPVLVVQRAADWDDALRLCNGVRQGLVAALFSGSETRQGQFLAEARAGILKINRSTAGADVEAPFGGWKASGVGPPEHGASNREFYTRTQALYR